MSYLAEIAEFSAKPGRGSFVLPGRQLPPNLVNPRCSGYGRPELVDTPGTLGYASFS